MKVNKELIVKKMQDKEISSLDMATAMNIASSTFNNKINNQRKMTATELLIVADKLDIDPFDVILDWNE